jgi:hypothetical protein
VSIKYTNIFHCKTLQNFHKFELFGLKNHMATLMSLHVIVATI